MRSQDENLLLLEHQMSLIVEGCDEMVVKLYHQDWNRHLQILSLPLGWPGSSNEVVAFENVNRIQVKKQMKHWRLLKLKKMSIKGSFQ